MDLNLRDKVAVITGGTVGIGLAVAEGLAAEGANLVLVGRNKERADDAKWQYYWDLHVMAAVRLARGLVPAMKRRGGGVVLHNASICAVQPLWYEPIYNTTKAALMMFSKTLANEVVGDNIRVNTINPGLVLTPDWIKTARQIAGEDGWQAHLQGVADEAGGMKRFATPQELANFFVFMCSDKASYSTGSTYFVDGGWLKTV
jgi:3-oxoacyl-[acyl-carrier protein] reductase